MIRLDGWQFLRLASGLHLVGLAQGDPRRADGHRVRTSRVVAYDGVLGAFVTQSSSAYELGEPDADFARVRGDARNHLIACLAEPADRAA